MTGQLKPGVVQVVSPSTGEILGYAFTEAHGKGQLQRWLLVRDPQNSFDIRPPPASMASWTLQDWQANVPGLWRPGSIYVWAQSDVYAYGSTYDGVVWTRIPSRLPKPTYPDVTPMGLQLDPTPWKIMVRQEDYLGWAYTVSGVTDASNVEYWMLPAGYQPAGGNHGVSIAKGTEAASSLDAFVTMINQSWGQGCTFVITGCVNYTGTVPPAEA